MTVTEAILELVHGAMSSPWIYLALFAFAAIDGFFPAVPSESLVITAGVFAATGEPNIVLVIAVSALGAFVGDHTSYLIGRSAGGRLDRLRHGTKRRKTYDWAGRTLAERGGLILVIARYIPGGRTAATMTMGAVRYPLRSFSFFDAIAALSWGLFSGLVGYIGGMAFEEDPLKGLLLGFGIAVAITVLVEVVRHVRQRRSRPDADAGTPAELPADQPSPAFSAAKPATVDASDEGEDTSSHSREMTAAGARTWR